MAPCENKLAIKVKNKNTGQTRALIYYSENSHIRHQTQPCKSDI